MAKEGVAGARRGRYLGATALLLVTWLLVAGAQASHSPVGEQEIDHLMLRIHDLGPQESHRFDIISSTHGDPRPGWIYTIVGMVHGNHSLDVQLRYANETLDTYSWPAGTTSSANTKIQEEGPHEILITNPLEETVRYAFYYDQTCNCESKRIGLSQGVVMFNYPFQAGSTMDISYPLLDDWHVYGALATHDDSLPTADWPDDFEILDEQEAQGPGAGQDGWGWLNFTFTPPQTGMYYVHIQALSDIPSPDDGMILGATIEEREQAAAPGPAGLVVVTVIALVVGLGSRLKRCA